MWRLLEKNELPLIGDEVLQSGSLFSWLPVVNNIESSTVGSLVIRRKIEDKGSAPQTSTNSDYAAALRALAEWVSDGGKCDLGVSFKDWCEKRLNSAQKPNCA